MSDSSSISSSQLPSYTTSIGADHRQADISNNDTTLSSTSISSSSLLTLGDTIAAALGDAYAGSAPQLEEPTLTALSQEDLDELSSLAENFSTSSTAPQAANSTAASQILATIELYLQQEKDLYDENYAPGAPNAQETSSYQQEIESSSLSQVPIHVAASALSVEQNTASTGSSASLNEQEKGLLHHIHKTTREEGSVAVQGVEIFEYGVNPRDTGRTLHPLTHHENPLTGTHGNVVGRDSRHDVLRKGVALASIHNKEVPPALSKALNTTTYTNEESLAALRKSILTTGRSNILSDLEVMKDMAEEERNQQIKNIFSKNKNMIVALQRSMATLAATTSKLREQPLKT